MGKRMLDNSDPLRNQQIRFDKSIRQTVAQLNEQSLISRNQSFQNKVSSTFNTGIRESI